MESVSIISDLAVITVSAAVVTVVFRALNLPVLLGYLLSGVLVGPHLLEVPWVKNLHTIDELSELGVAFLMFYIGLEFDLKKLQRTLGPAFLGVTLQTVFMIFMGIMTAPLLGWSGVNGLFLGCLLAISSTMITIPILKSQNALKTNFAQLAIGMLILEDILAIMVLVVLTGVGVTGKFQWDQAWKVVFFVGVFVGMVYFLGKLFSRKLLKLLRKFGNPEMITVVSVGLLLGIGELAETFNFSIALGAFLAGSILSQSDLAHEIETAIEPLRSLFTAVFFVTIGMKIEPALLGQYWLSIAGLTLVVVLGKILTVFLGLFLAGEKPNTAFKAATCKAQIGEFSFVIAQLGLSYGIVNNGMMTIAVGVALGTTMIIPFVSERAEGFYQAIAHRMPKRIQYTGEFYNHFSNALKVSLQKSTFLTLVKRPMLQAVGYFLLFNGILIVAYLSINYLDTVDFLRDHRDWAQYGVWIVAGLLCLPFLIAIIRNMEVVVLLITESAFSNKTNRIFTRGRMRNIINTGILCIAIAILGGIYLSMAAAFLPSGVALIGFIIMIALLSLFFWRHIVRVNSRLEQLFAQSFHSEVQNASETRRNLALKAFSQKHPWHIDLYDVEITTESQFCGKPIIDLKLREKTGVSIVGLSRDNFTIYDPSPDIPLFPGDHVILIGNKTEIEAAKTIINQPSEQKESKLLPEGKFEIDKAYLGSHSELIGNTIAQAGIRRKFKLTIIGIQRGEKRITSPSPDEILKAGDILVVVGTKKIISHFKEIIETDIDPQTTTA